MLEGAALEPPRRLACARVGAISAAMVKATVAAATEREEEKEVVVFMVKERPVKKKCMALCVQTVKLTPFINRKKQ